LFAWLTAEGFSIALINPIRTRRFAEKELQRTKTDHVDALAIARFAAQKRLKPTKLSERFAQELRALVHLRNQTIQHLGDHTRHLDKAIDLTFPEFTRNVRGLDTELATAILSRYLTAASFLKARIGKLAGLCFDGRRRVGTALARELIKAAMDSVGSDQTETCAMQVRYACEDIITMRTRARQREADIERRLTVCELGQLFPTIPGISTLTAAAIIAEAGDPARFRDARAFAS
jgi:transposase